MAVASVKKTIDFLNSIIYLDSTDNKWKLDLANTAAGQRGKFGSIVDWINAIGNPTKDTTSSQIKSLITVGGFSVDPLESVKVGDTKYGQTTIAGSGGHVYISLPDSDKRNCNQGLISIKGPPLNNDSLDQANADDGLSGGGTIILAPMAPKTGLTPPPEVNPGAVRQEGGDGKSGRSTITGLNQQTEGAEQRGTNITGRDPSNPANEISNRGLKLQPGHHVVTVTAIGTDLGDPTQVIMQKKTVCIYVNPSGQASMVDAPTTIATADTLTGSGAQVDIAPNTIGDNDTNSNVDIFVTGQAGINLDWKINVEIDSKFSGETKYVHA